MPFFYSDQSSYNSPLLYYTLFRKQGPQDLRAVDLETDILVTIKQDFSECTIITIAHTIMDSTQQQGDEVGPGQGNIRYK